MPDIIHTDQSGLIVGRHSVVNVRRVMAVMQRLETNKPPGHHAVLLLDAEKAFNLVTWDHLFDSLHRFGFSDAFISVLHQLYAGSSSQILSNGYLFFPVLNTPGYSSGLPPIPLLICKRGVEGISDLVAAGRGRDLNSSYSKLPTRHQALGLTFLKPLIFPP